MDFWKQIFLFLSFIICLSLSYYMDGNENPNNPTYREDAASHWEVFNYSLSNMYKLNIPPNVADKYTNSDGTINRTKAEAAASLEENGIFWASQIECTDWLHEFLQSGVFSPVGSKLYYEDAQFPIADSVDSLCIQQKLITKESETLLIVKEKVYDFTCLLDPEDYRITCACDQSMEKSLKFYCQGQMEILWSDCKSTILVVYNFDSVDGKAEFGVDEASIGAWVAFSLNKTIIDPLKTEILEKIESWGFEKENAVFADYSSCPEKDFPKSTKDKPKAVKEMKNRDDSHLIKDEEVRVHDDFRRDKGHPKTMRYYGMRRRRRKHYFPGNSNGNHKRHFGMSFQRYYRHSNRKQDYENPDRAERRKMEFRFTYHHRHHPNH